VTGAHVHEELGGYVLGSLDPAERDAVAAHLAECPICAAEHARLAGLPALLALAEHIENAPPLSPAVEERVLDAVAREHARPDPSSRRRWPAWPRRRLVAIGGAVAVAACAVALAIALTGGGPRIYKVPLEPVAGESAAGRAELSRAKNGTRLHLWVRDLPPDPNVVYEVRCDARNWSASAGTFRADSDGRAVVVLTTAARRGDYDSIRIVRRTRSESTDVLTASLN
jgi:Putative zinc-finger